MLGIPFAWSVWGRWGCAKDLFAMMSCRPALRSTISLNSALDACARGSQWEWSVQTLATEPARDEISFSSTTSAYANCNLWPKSLCMLGKMKENLLRPHEIMYNSVAASFEHSGHWRLATGLFHEMCSKNLADLISIGLILSRYSESAPWFSALILGSQMSQMRLPSSSMSQHALVKSILTAPAGFAWRWARQLLEVQQVSDLATVEQLALRLEKQPIFSGGRGLPEVLEKLPLKQLLRSLQEMICARKSACYFFLRPIARLLLTPCSVLTGHEALGYHLAGRWAREACWFGGGCVCRHLRSSAWA